MESELLRLGLYGRNGSGKSTLIASVPDTEKLLVVSEEGQNIRPYMKAPHIKVTIAHTWDDVIEIYKIVGKAKSQGSGPTVVAFDGWPIRLIINKVLNAHLAPGEEKEWLVNPPDSFPSGKEIWDQWDEIAALSKWGMLAWFRQPVHLVFSFDEQDPKIEKGEVTRRGGPLLNNQPLVGVKHYLEIIGRLFAEVVDAPFQLGSGVPENVEERRRLLLGENEFWYAKGPVHVLGHCMVDPTYTKLLAAVHAEPLRLNGYHKKEEEEF